MELSGEKGSEGPPPLVSAGQLLPDLVIAFGRAMPDLSSLDVSGLPALLSERVHRLARLVEADDELLAPGRPDRAAVLAERPHLDGTVGPSRCAGTPLALSQARAGGRGWQASLSR